MCSPSSLVRGASDCCGAGALSMGAHEVLAGNSLCRMEMQDLMSKVLCEIQLVITKDKRFVIELWYKLSDYRPYW